MAGEDKIKADRVTEKERIQILLAEYTSLRTEINARMTSVYTVASFGVAVNREPYTS